MTLTDRQIRAAKVPQGLNQIELRDDQVRGLLLRVYAGGARTWMLAYRRQEDNRRRQLKLGDYPGVSLKQARQLAEVEVGRVATGDDPKGERDERRAGSSAPTVAEVAELYLTSYAQEHKRPKGYAMDRWQIVRSHRLARDPRRRRRHLADRDRGGRSRRQALRYATTYDFRFDADRSLAPVVATLGLFRAGSPEV